MKWACALEETPSLEGGLEVCSDKVLEELDGLPVHLAVVFVSHAFPAAPETVSQVLSKRLGSPVVLGCAASGIIGNFRELERTAGISLTVASLPQVEIRPFHLLSSQYPSPDDPPAAWRTMFDIPTDEPVSFVLIGDPFTSYAESLLEGIDYAFPQSTVIGGISSGGQPGDSTLFLGNEVHHQGVVGIATTGNVALETVVAQGCRPIGKAARITSCKDNELLGIDGNKPIKYLDELYKTLPEQDQALVRQSLFLGVVMDSFNESPSHGDYLIRNIIGADQNKGTLTVGALIRKGQTVQFHVRDAETSSDDLTTLLDEYADKERDSSPKGALLFSCLGRGEHLYKEPNHDSKLFKKALDGVPLGGFFCNGEIGPVGETTYLHGYTSSIGLFRERG